MKAKRSGRGGLVGAGFRALEEALIGLLLVALTATALYRLVMSLLGAPARADPGAWLLTGMVLLGMSYAVRVNAHLGVDAFVKLFGPGPRRVFGLLAVSAGLAYASLLLIGAWDHVAGLYRLGSEAGMPPWQQMAILPAGFVLLLWRLVQAGARIWARQQEDLLHGDAAADALNHHLASLAESDAPTVNKPGRR
jgi:C4-dicarboxylate transporter DctQ subunit